MKSWEKVAEKRGVEFRYKGNMKNTLAYLNCI